MLSWIRWQVQGESVAAEFLQEIVGELDIGLVNFVDQQDGQLRSREGFPQLALLDVIADVVNTLVTQLAITKTGNRIIFVQPLLRFGRAFHVPFDQRRVDRFGNLVRQYRFTGARFTFYQQRATQGHRSVDGHFEIVSRNVVLCALETCRHA